MGGFGSGRDGWRRRVEHYSALDIDALRRAEVLEPDTDCLWGLFGGASDGGRINIRAGTDHLRLIYRIHDRGSGWQDVDQVVRVEHAPCRYGGARAYFLCPGSDGGRPCGRRVVKLYAAGRLFLCRACHGLAYASQAEGPFERKRRRANKLRRAMGGEASGAAPYPERPKGMWRRTYERRLDELDRKETEALGALADVLARLRRV